MSGPDPATRAQQAAADPAGSVWLSANAGSGKTKVLTDRVARLLLRGVSPERILCLTYTKAAASEMQNRLFERLGGWAMLPEPELRVKLQELGLAPSELSAPLVSKARTLFARAIETPGGLKIQTIHSFCSGLLRRFPMEAGLPPQFKELDEPGTRALRQRVLANLASGSELTTLEAMAGLVAETNFDSFLSEMAAHTEALRSPDAGDALRRSLGLSPDDNMEDLIAQVITPGDDAMLLRLIDALAVGSPTDMKQSQTLRVLSQAPRDAAFLEGLEKIFLTGATAKIGAFVAKIPGFPTKKTRENLGALEAPLDELMRRVEAARSKRLALAMMARNEVLLTFARAYLAHLQSAKEALGVLDFDDLILRTRSLLTDPGVAQWVLFRLDGGIDHILVDEAQDTSPAQWDVIRLLAQEFTAGQGAATDRDRTLFVVGDPKQSIYSFQGADPGGFDRMRVFFRDALERVHAPFAEHALLYSFRSSPGILGFVDHCFESTGHMGLGHRSDHRAFRETLPGRVDVWPVLPTPEEPVKPFWYDPVDLENLNDPKLELARQVARSVQDMLCNGTQITTAKGETRPVQPKDVLILVQRRSAIFHEIIRSCKDLGVPIAGADRLQVGAELAVKDLVAVLSFLATPEDDLALASVLRSPLFEFSEDQLYRLAQPREGKFLIAALRDTADQHPDALAILQDLLGEADFLRPYELLDRILTRHGGRAKLLARLGHEAEDGIDALLAQALSYEAGNVPSLTGFLSWFLSDDLTIKRQMDTQRDEVRVMTVHGSKGLEAPIVILPDCAKTIDRSHQKRLISLNGDVSGMRPSRADAPMACLDAIDAERAAAAEERMRLLYVAMTRAESWLIVAAAGEIGDGLDSWHAIADATMKSLAEGAEDLACPTGQGRRLSFGAWPDPAPSEEQLYPGAAKPLVLAPLPAPPTKSEPVSPSHLGGAKVTSGAEDALDRDAAMDRGTQIHLLLEHLPDIDASLWATEAETLLAPILEDPRERAEVANEALSVLKAPALRALFGPEALAEVDVTAPLPQIGRTMLGTIDRLLVSKDEVLAVDFKSNAAIPARADDTPLGILRQMGAYLVALEAIYPDRPVKVAVVWTRTATQMDLPADLVRDALANASVSVGGP